MVWLLRLKHHLNNMLTADSCWYDRPYLTDRKINYLIRSLGSLAAMICSSQREILAIFYISMYNNENKRLTNLCTIFGNNRTLERPIQSAGEPPTSHPFVGCRPSIVPSSQLSSPSGAVWLDPTALSLAGRVSTPSAASRMWHMPRPHHPWCASCCLSKAVGNSNEDRWCDRHGMEEAATMQRRRTVDVGPEAIWSPE